MIRINKQLEFLIYLFILFSALNTFSQNDKIRSSLKAKVAQTIGIDTEITIDFSRPGVKGRTIWGEVVPYGLAEGNKYSENRPYPWRAGANENTTFEISKDIMVESNLLPKGKYSLHMIPGKDEWIIIFNKNNTLWGSYKYNSEEDALRIVVKPEKAEHEEWLKYGFKDLDGTSATAFLHWEELIVPFKVQVTE